MIKPVIFDSTIGPRPMEHMRAGECLFPVTIDGGADVGQE